MHNYNLNVFCFTYPFFLDCFWLMDHFLNYTLDFGEVPFQGVQGGQSFIEDPPTRLEGMMSLRIH